MIKVGMISLGCSKNQVDAERMLAELKSAGFEITNEEVRLSMQLLIIKAMKHINMNLENYVTIKIASNLLGVDNANVTIELYSDYVCPLCYINNIMIHQAAKEFKNIYACEYMLVMMETLYGQKLLLTIL